jgi:hypothetical protein
MTLTKTLAFSTALVAAVGFAAMPQPAHALGTGAAVGIGLGALAVGTAIGASQAPYYGYPGYYGYPATAPIRLMRRAVAGARIMAVTCPARAAVW